MIYLLTRPTNLWFLLERGLPILSVGPLERPWRVEAEKLLARNGDLGWAQHEAKTIELQLTTWYFGSQINSTNGDTHTENLRK